MMYYRDDQFAEKVGAKRGTVVCFKRILREAGKIGVRQQLTDKDVETFKRALEWRNMTNSTLEQAFKTMIVGTIWGPPGVGKTKTLENQSNIEQLGHQISNIIESIDEIENIWWSIPDDVSDDLMDGYPTQIGSLEDVSDALKKWMVHIQKVKDGQVKKVGV